TRLPRSTSSSAKPRSSSHAIDGRPRAADKGRFGALFFVCLGAIISAGWPNAGSQECVSTALPDTEIHCASARQVPAREGSLPRFGVTPAARGDQNDVAFAMVVGA